MRRGISILLVVFFVLGPLSALLQADTEARLPPCCRRHGAHHCAMSMAIQTRMTTGFPAKPDVSAPATCRNFPQGSFATLSPDHALAQSNAIVSAVPLHNDSPVEIAIAPRMNRLRIRADRGPPSLGID